MRSSRQPIMLVTTGPGRPSDPEARAAVCGDAEGSAGAPGRLADAFHVYGLLWTKGELVYYFDGEVIRRMENTHWHQPLHMNFDSETMPEWFGLPDEDTLPSTFSVEYVRSWRAE